MGKRRTVNNVLIARKLHCSCVVAVLHDFDREREPLAFKDFLRPVAAKGVCRFDWSDSGPTEWHCPEHKPDAA